MSESKSGNKYERPLEYYSRLIDREHLVPNGKIKDTAFALCIKRKDYLLDFYKNIHPEDTSVTQDDIRLVNIENLFIEDIYNDCSFTVRGKKLILIECQSVWTENIGYRLMEYCTALYPMVVPDFQIRKHRRKKLDVPDFELYVFYVGKESVPEEIHVTSLSFPELHKPYIPVGVLTGRNSSGRAKEFFDFCETRDRNASLYGNSIEAIEKTIFECLDRGILVELINEKKYELEAHMRQSEKLKYAQYMKMTVEEAIQEGLEKGWAKCRSEGIAAGREEGMAAGREEGMAAGREEGREVGRAEGIASNMEKTMRIIREADIPDASKELLIAKLSC